MFKTVIIYGSRTGDTEAVATADLKGKVAQHLVLVDSVTNPYR